MFEHQVPPIYPDAHYLLAHGYGKISKASAHEHLTWYAISVTIAPLMPPGPPHMRNFNVAHD